PQSTPLPHTTLFRPPEAISGAHENFKLNDVADRARIVAGNAFDELRRLDRSGERFGLVVLDPPPFARGRDALDAAARGYKEVNRSVEHTSELQSRSD